MRADQDSSLAHQRFAPVQVEEIAEQHVVDEQRVHDRVDVVRPEVRDAKEQHVGLAVHGDHLLLVVVPERLFVHGVGRPRVHARHPVRAFDGVQ